MIWKERYGCVGMHKLLMNVMVLCVMCTLTACTNSETSTSESMHTEKTEDSTFNSYGDNSRKTVDTLDNSDYSSATFSDADSALGSVETTEVNIAYNFSENTTFSNDHKGKRLYLDTPTETTTEHQIAQYNDVKSLKDAGFEWAGLGAEGIYDEIANAFMQKDINKLKSFFCEKSSQLHDLDKEIAECLSCIDGNIIQKQDEVYPLWSGGYSQNDGIITGSYSYFHINGFITDTGKTYELSCVLVETGDDISKLGIHCIYLCEEVPNSDNLWLYQIAEDFTGHYTNI